MSTITNKEYIEVPTQNSPYNSTVTTATSKKSNCIKYSLISSAVAIIVFMVVFGLSNSTSSDILMVNSTNFIHSKDVFNSLDSNESEEDTTDGYTSTINESEEDTTDGYTSTINDVENIEDYGTLKDVIIKNKTVIINGNNDSIVIS